MQTPSGSQELNPALFQAENNLQQFVEIMDSDISLEDSSLIKPELITRSSPQKQNKIQITQPIQGDCECEEEPSPMRQFGLVNLQPYIICECEEEPSPMRQSGPVNLCPHVICTLAFNEELLNILRNTGTTEMRICDYGCKFNFRQPLSNILRNIQQQLITNQLQYIKNNAKILKNGQTPDIVDKSCQDLQNVDEHIQNEQTDQEYYKIVSCKNTHCEFFFFQIDGINKHYCPQCLASYLL